MMMGQIIVRCLDLPYKTNGLVRKDGDGNYNVYINAKMSYAVQRKTIRHEIAHIRHGDFDSFNDIRMVENL